MALQHRHDEPSAQDQAALSRLVRGINNLLGIGSQGNRDGNGYGGLDGVQHGEPNGEPDGHQHGELNGQLNGQPHGAQHGHQHGEPHGGKHGQSNGEPYGTQYGHQHGSRHGTTQAIELRVVGDTLRAYPLGCKPAPTAEQHAREFVVWLQVDALAAYWETRDYVWVEREVLEKHLYPRFIKDMTWPPHAWKTVATCIRKLKLMEWRQADRRQGWDRQGRSPIEYRVIRPGE